MLGCIMQVFSPDEVPPNTELFGISEKISSSFVSLFPKDQDASKFRESTIKLGQGKFFKNHAPGPMQR